ncbi:MAG TPA: AAA family ATPase, partial [Clostridiales bacterium]|nr:AAA family ATPase [Clostridiales bacterium]
MIVWSDMEALAKKHLSSLIYNSEYNFDSQVIRIADKIYAEKAVKMILIAGPSASGKTTFANLLADRLEFRGVKVHRISTDDFFIDRDKIEVLPNGLLDMDSLNAMDVKLLTFTIESLLEGNRVVIPRFDFVEGKRAGDTRE